jgi:cytochrome bd-type quinol oxidase subunit 1
MCPGGFFMLAKLLMAKIFALLVAAFVLLRGLILFPNPLLNTALALGLILILVLIWMPTRITAYLKGHSADVKPAESEAASETQAEPELNSEAGIAERPELSPEDQPVYKRMPVALAGWSLLLLLLAAVLFLGPDEEPALPELDLSGFAPGGSAPHVTGAPELLAHNTLQ